MEYEQIGLELGETQEEKGGTELPPNIRIRKLTPKECYRLMGFDDASFGRAKYQQETYYLEGEQNDCNAKLKAVSEKQKLTNTDTYVLCTIKDMCDMEMLKQMVLKSPTNENSTENKLNVSIVMPKWEESERLECATNTTKCITFIGMHFSLITKNDPQARMVIIAQENMDKANTGKCMKIITESNLTQVKLYTILTLFVLIIESKIFTSSILKANIQGVMQLIVNSQGNILMKLSNLKMECTKERMSNSSLYKQAGNSIVVSVLEAIMGQFFEGKERHWERWLSEKAYESRDNQASD